MRSDKSKETGYSADVTRKKASDQADAPFAEPYVRRAGLRDIPQLYRLWQGCFGDSDSFTDYYFDTYFPENEVWVVEKKGRITAQLHENLYELKAGIRRIPGVYIVGVSTDKSQRHQGQMSALLARVFREQREKKLPFLYLMPADEAIYLPSQFAYIYAQHEGSIPYVMLRPYRYDDAEAFLKLENTLFSLPWVADYRAARRADGLRLEVLTCGAPPLKLPDLGASWSLRPVRPEDRPLIAEKRGFAKPVYLFSSE